MRPKTLAWSLCALAIALLLAGCVLAALNGFANAYPWGSDAVIAALLAPGLAASLVGAFVASRHPRNAVGWICLDVGVALGFSLAAAHYGYFAVETDPGALVAGEVVASLASWAWLAWVGPLLVHLVLVFPDGRLPSRRWRVVAWLGAAGFVVAGISGTLVPGPLEQLPGVRNPLGVEGAGSVLEAARSIGVDYVFPACIVAAAVSMFLRYREADGHDRRQIKWFAFAVGLTALLVTVGVLTVFQATAGGGLIAQDLMTAGFAAPPVAVGLAILRHRLYDIDVVVNRTLVYGGLTLLLLAAYGATTLLLGTALGSGSTLATAGATLVAAAAFRPLRARLQDLVDRRFNRADYDALRRISAFMDDLHAGRAAPDAIEGLLAEVLDAPGLELQFFMPASHLYVDRNGEPVTVAAGDSRERIHVSRAGAPVAILLCHPAEDRPAVSRIAEAAKLPIEIARLHVELRRQLDEVKASRARILAAGEEERRRIERDLHDGAQQRLLSVGLALRHLQHHLDPGDAGEELDKAVKEVGAVIRELRDLARGIRPAGLDGGLAPALEELAGRAPLPVEIDATRERFPQDLEAASYFIACEGLTNAIKHARATKVVISIARSNGSLVVSVADDGVGGARAAGGSGLRGVADRAVAHGGRVEIDSGHGRGTRLTAELPCGS